MTVKDNLIAAKALIADPAKWIKGAYEQNGCYCVSGAIARASGCGRAMGPEWRAVAKLVPTGVPSTFNDHPDTTHADIMALFDRAIAAQDEVAK